MPETKASPVENTLTIAVDCMGADFDPVLAVEASTIALAQDPALRIQIFGQQHRLEPALKHCLPEQLDRLEATDCPDVVPMDSSPARALRMAQRSSMARAMESEQAAAMVSAGNTGALMALARARLGMLPGIERPALMTAFPVRQGQTWVLDLGANIGVDADRLYEFAVLGSAAVSVLIESRPRVALLNIGTEDNKGPDVIREAARRLSHSDLDFVGFIEGHSVFEGKADVVVCDGFAGNILLKSAEGAIRMLFDSLKDWQDSWWRRPLLQRRMKVLAQRYDPRMHNGASLLGINGIVVKSHAHADAVGLAQAIGLAALEVRRGMLPELERQLWLGSGVGE